MPPEERDPAFLYDMLEAAQKVQKYVEGRTYQDYSTGDQKAQRRVLDRLPKRFVMPVDLFATWIRVRGKYADGKSTKGRKFELMSLPPRPDQELTI